ncbi:GNAT family N-acetyltransferase [Nocardioides panacis]|uniref:GNAT family N-acetyltransferase n=1 Tax=Nocardioides panacis TaxID=2849501 RepID=A0A975T0W6_9ACTN|nr:GNAT family N-acetyltransferase [Nocardioides panacis]QWZ09554.1 GNAT family N-acetyltransferase [Nocardioides panacis]
MVMSVESLVHPRRRTLQRALVPPSSFAVVDPVRDPRWAALAQTASGSCAFHHPAWLAMLERVYGYQVIACAVLDGDGRFEAGLPMALVGGRVNRARLVALPFSDVVVPLARDARASQWHRLRIALDQFRQQNALSIELRGEFPGVPREAISTYRHHLLSLTQGYEAVVSGMKPQVARGERRARREGLRVEFRTDGGALGEFFDLHVRTRKRQGVPTQPRRFIMALEDLFAEGLGFVVVVRDGRVPATAAVFLSSNGTLIYKYGASDPRLLAKRPNNLLFMDTIRWACEHGLERLDFGRTDADHDSLCSFKRSFGAAETSLAYSTLAGDDVPARRGHVLAATVIRRSPPFVGRFAGELLYRDFAA